jgi:hypothetical protein
VVQDSKIQRGGITTLDLKNAEIKLKRKEQVADLQTTQFSVERKKYPCKRNTRTRDRETCTPATSNVSSNQITDDMDKHQGEIMRTKIQETRISSAFP